MMLMLFAISVIGQDKTVSQYQAEAKEFIEKAEYFKAFGVLNEGIREMPDSSFLYLDRGNLYMVMRLFKEATKDYSVALEQTDDIMFKSILLSNRGGAKAKIRDFEGAYDDLLKAYQIDSTNLGALNNLATVCADLGRIDEAITFLTEVTILDSNYASAYVNLGFLYQRNKEHEKAIEYFGQGIRLDPKEPLAYSNRSFSRLQLHDLKGAMEDINYSLELYPGNSYAYKNRALIHIENKDFEKACEDLHIAKRLFYTKQYGEEVNELLAKYCRKK